MPLECEMACSIKQNTMVKRKGKNKEAERKDDELNSELKMVSL